MTRACAREDQVVSAVLSGAWPDRCDDALVAHAAQCGICGEVAAVATLLRMDHDHARREAHLPAAGQVWWRAAVRARLEAAHASTQPMTWMHGITAACALGLLLGATTLAWPSIAGAAAWLTTLVLGTAPSGNVAGVMAGTLRQGLPLVLLAAVGVLLAPVALYFALSDE